jgi:hypothetical protein
MPRGVASLAASPVAGFAENVDAGQWLAAFQWLAGIWSQ